MSIKNIHHGDKTLNQERFYKYVNSPMSSTLLLHSLSKEKNSINHPHVSLFHWLRFANFTI